MKKLDMIINTKAKKSMIHKEIYGHFSEHLGRCIYNGIYVGKDSPIPNTNGMRNDVVNALKGIKIPVLRWPGGCFADEYHWKDGIGPKENRKKMVNTNWGGVVEDNSFGTHEFFELCSQLGSDPYICGNLGSGTIQEMSEWIEYMTFDGISPMSEERKKNGHESPWKLKYFGVGNENWGCGGNMRPEYYADEYRRYQSYCKNYGDNKLFKIACGPNGPDYNWTDKFMSLANKYCNAISLHYYTVPGNWSKKGSATEFDEDEYYSTLKKTYTMKELIENHTSIMNKYDPDKKVGLVVDEWGTWYDVEKGTTPAFLYQQNTMRDALVASINLNIFNEHSDRVVMANIAQVVNVLQSVILTEGDKMIKTPTYHVFDMYKHHQDSTLIDSFIENVEIAGENYNLPSISKSVSIDKDNKLHLTLSNCSLSEDFTINIDLIDFHFSKVNGKLLSQKMTAHNTFEKPNTVCPTKFKEYNITDKGIKFIIPKCSIISLTLE
ncbi:alpha-N-arabinofuranosidase [Clostridium sp. SHJSY1]|uniref:alpha-N-arabinofuranosidase n=1 Tax=Clostridium sp. SHJSY1 TaxID=2942483 RepID=UPI002877198E|nr:alpha-N-arabinofuranosidase [Clostridium sp. SHJSY1]MDS0524676.1 alpha-N-arabinofuranosidase [Clostridium sp. SHJSY1]